MTTSRAADWDDPTALSARTDASAFAPDLAPSTAEAGTSAHAPTPTDAEDLFVAAPPLAPSTYGLTSADWAPLLEMVDIAAPPLPADAHEPVPRQTLAEPDWRQAGPLTNDGGVLYGDVLYADGVPGGTNTTATLAVGGSTTNVIETTGDSDWFRIQLAPGQTYTFTLNASGSPALADPFLRLRDATGSVVAQNDDAGSGTTNSRLSFSLPDNGVGGTFYLDVQGFGSSTGGYTLTSLPAAKSATNQLDIGEMNVMANWLTNGFWTFNGGSWRAFNHSTISVNTVGLTTEGRALALAALQLWSDVTGLNFQGTTGAADITFDDNQTGAFASSSISNHAILSSTVNVGTDWLGSYGTGLNSYSLQTYVHEIGHAIGLGHGGPYNGSANYLVDSNQQWDSWQTTVMSYFSENQNTFFHSSYAYALTPQVADILAARQLYGDPNNVRTADTVYGVGSNAGNPLYDPSGFGSPISITLLDNGGIDTINASTSTAAQLFNLNQGGASNVFGGIGNMMIAAGTVIENAVGGSGSDVFIGNTSSNSFIGGAGIDTVMLKAINGAGSETVSYGGVQYALTRGQGADTIQQVENFSDGHQTVGVAALPTFDPLAYGASYNDLALAFRTDAGGLLSHYLVAGFYEGREVTFSVTQYLANFADLRAAFGPDGAAATAHFLNGGVQEHRLAEDPLDYIASYADLIAAFHGNGMQQMQALGLNHYAGAGYDEGRRGGIDFDAAQYLANYADLALAFGTDLDGATVHYIDAGYSENRLAADPLTYLASYADLTQAFGDLSLSQAEQAGLNHYSAAGKAEGRGTHIDFDVNAYLANYADLRAAFADGLGGYDEHGATYHYIAAGFDEGRTDTLLV